jgi:THO complex subunit 2
MDWERSGRVEFVNRCREQLNEPNEIRQSVYQLLDQVIQGQVKPTQASNGLLELVQMHGNYANTIADVLLLLDFETQVKEDKSSRSHFLDLLVCCSNTVLPESLLKERLDFDTCGDANIVPNKKTAQTKFIKLKTRLFYKQQKFNLYREESEGYAKLITELKDESNANAPHALEMLKSFIGCFNLDPNRVLDVILECFESSLHQHHFYVQLITSFLNNSSTLTQILAFKFNFYQHDASLFTPNSLYEVTAILIKNNLITLDDIWEYLLPTDRDIHQYYDQLLQEEKKNSNRLMQPTGELKVDEQLDELIKHQLKADNQKVSLCFYLLKVADWSNGLALLKRLPPNYILSHPKLSLQLCQYLHYVINPFYRSYCGLNSLIQKRIPPPTYSFAETIQTVATWSEFKQIAFPILDQLGAFIYCDQLLVAKLIRILRALMPKHAKEIRYDALNLLGDNILPAITMIESNCALSEELWHVLRYFPYTIRYKLYSNWCAPLPIPQAYRNRGNIQRKIKYIMKRLSKENVKMFGRQIGKLTHSNPSYMFDYILSQIQSYDNLIGPVIDSFKYLNSVSYDVLIYCVIETLANPNKKKTNLDAASISPWMLSLSNFCGAVVKKYPVELPGLLQFIANQLKTKQSLDLIILKEIIQKMTGIEATDEMTEDQIAALSGGELLKNEGGYFHQVRNTRKSSARLKEALLESDLAMPLCILMAQQRNCILFYDQEHSYLKLVSKLYDQCQQTLVQYGSFLASNLSIDDYIGHLPSIHKLIQKFHLSSDVVFYLTRPMIVHNVNQMIQQLLIKNPKYNEKEYTHAYFEAWDSVTQSIVNSMGNDVNHKLWSNLSPKFFMSFWALTNYDLQVPTGSYEKEADRLKGQIQAAEDKDMPAGKKKKEIERCRALLERLMEEQQRQEEHVRRVRLRLDREKIGWFGAKMHRVEMTIQFLQHCLIPRCVFTANDALYCAEFVHLLHTIQTPNFSTLICYDRIFCDISYSLSMCTEDGANNYGRFLCGLLKTIMSWHKDRIVFERECARYPGFVTKFGDNDPVYVDYENYRHVCHKWHYRLTKAFIFCLDSGDYMQIRNSLIVLTKVLPHLPVMTSFANVIEKHVEQLRVKEKEKRPDLYALATG